jgi:uncharacterized protein (TIGR03437 family)
MCNRSLLGFCCMTLLSAANLLNAQSTLTVVSAAGAQSVVAPGALATVYGQFSVDPAIGVLNTLGQFPTQLSGMALDFNGVSAQLLYVGPDQINFLVPSDAGFGTSKLNVMAGDKAFATTAIVEPVAPAIFTSISNGREVGAVLNAVTFQSGPFHAQTPEIPGCDNRTRLAVYATGLGLTTHRAKDRDVSVQLIDSSGATYSAEVMAALAAPGYVGLDQVNFTLPGVIHAGTVRMQILVNGVASNQVQFDLADSAMPGDSACLGNITISRAGSQSGAPYQGTVSLAFSPAAGAVTVNLLADDGVTIPGAVIIPAGQTWAAFPIASGNGSQAVHVAAVLNGGTRYAAFDPSQACVNGIALSSDGIVSGMGLKGSVMLTDPAPASGITVNLISNLPLVTITPAATVSAGQMTASFDITTAQTVAPARAVLTASGSCGGTSTGLNLVLTPCVSAVTLASTVQAGSGKITGTVKLNAPALSGGLLVNLATSDPSLQADPSVRVAEGQTTATFTVNASAVSTRTSATVTASVASCASASASVTLMPM